MLIFLLRNKPPKSRDVLYIEDGVLTLEEYQAKKQKLLNEKLDIEQKIRDFEQSGNNWLEPMREMIFEAKQAKILLSQGDNYQIREFLKNVGSNFILKDKKFNFAPKRKFLTKGILIASQ